MLFTGDSLVRTPTLIFFGDSELNTVEAYHEKLVELQKRESEFDALYPGHFETPRPVQILDDMVKLSAMILAEPDKFDDWQDMHGNEHAAKRRHHGLAHLAFDERHIYKKSVHNK